MFAWLEQAEPRVLETLEWRAFFKVLDAMVRVSVQRCSYTACSCTHGVTTSVV
jgi:hypothetical protein